MSTTERGTRADRLRPHLEPDPQSLAEHLRRCHEFCPQRATVVAEGPTPRSTRGEELHRRRVGSSG